MKKFLHRLLSILLILTFGISGTLYFFFDAVQFRDKLAAREHISSQDKLDVITIPLKDFKIQERDGEIWYGGQLYDVASYSIEGDVACVSVYLDSEEGGLVKNIVASFEPNDKPASDFGTHIAKHKIHYPNDGKVLVSTFALTRLLATKTYHPESRFLSASIQVCYAVIKPPPRMS